MTKRVVLIDDDARNTFALAAILKTRSVVCTSYAEAAEAISALSQAEEIPDAILIDMMMPEMDGFEAIPKIKAISRLKDVPVISVTALAMKGDKEKCLEAGADYYISKPIDVDILFQLLKI